MMEAPKTLPGRLALHHAGINLSPVERGLRCRVVVQCPFNINIQYTPTSKACPLTGCFSGKPSVLR